MEIQPLLIDETLKFIDSYVKKAKVTIAGVEKEYPIFKTKIEGKEIKKFVYITNETGLISDARLIDAQGRNIHVKKMNIVKDKHGFMIVFKINLKIEGV